MIQALVVEDAELAAYGVERALTEGGISVSARVPTLELATAQPLPDVVLLDLGLPGNCRLETVSQLRQAWPSVPILVITVQLNTDIALWVLRDGALGLVDKDIRPLALAKALETVNSGDHLILPELAANLLHRPLPAERKPLLEAESSVLEYLADGLDLDRISLALSRSRRFVASILSDALTKVTPPRLTAGELRALLAIDTGLPNKVAARLLGMNEKNFGGLLTSVRAKMSLPPGETRLLSLLANRLHAGCQLTLDEHLGRQPVHFVEPA